MLSKGENKIYSKIERIQIRGKRGKKVPILFTKNMSQCINKIIEMRKENGVSDTNIYVFELPFSSKSFRGCNALREEASKCGAEFEHTLTSSKLRKHVSTQSQSLNFLKK